MYVTETMLTVVGNNGKRGKENDNKKWAWAKLQLCFVLHSTFLLCAKKEAHLLCEAKNSLSF